MSRSSARGIGTIPFWAIVIGLTVAGFLSLPSIGLLLLTLAFGALLVGALRSRRPVAAALLGLVVAYLVFAPGICSGGSAGAGGGSDDSCTSLAFVPLGGENWIPFLVIAPVLVALAVAWTRRQARARTPVA